MKTILALSILLCTIALPSVGELTIEDIEKIDAKIKESEARTKEHINTQIESVDKRLSLVTSLIIGLMALIGIPLAVLTVMIGWRSIKDSTPERKNIRELTREQMEELVLEQMKELTSEDKRAIEQLIRDQEQKIESLTQEIETLKQQQTVNP